MLGILESNLLGLFQEKSNQIIQWLINLAHRFLIREEEKFYGWPKNQYDPRTLRYVA